VITFGTAITDGDVYRDCAEPGIRVAAESDSEVIALEPAGPVSRNLNLLVDRAAGRDDLEALVLVSEEVEIADPGFCATIRQQLRDPNVAVIGCLGASGVRSIAWWEGSASRARVVHCYPEHGGGEIAAFAWTRPRPAPAEVDVVDGRLIVLSPWAVRNLRFDETLSLNYGYDVDFCLRARAAGRKVMTADVRVTYHGPLELVREPELWIEAHIGMAARWDGRMPGADAGTAHDWTKRARLAEARREAARTVAYSTEARMEAQLLPLERRLTEITETRSWRMTAPLRRLNQRRSQALRSLRGRRS
jgi:Glycosyltransferase like family